MLKKGWKQIWCGTKFRMSGTAWLERIRRNFGRTQEPANQKLALIFLVFTSVKSKGGSELGPQSRSMFWSEIPCLKFSPYFLSDPYLLMHWIEATTKLTFLKKHKFYLCVLHKVIYVSSSRFQAVLNSSIKITTFKI